MRQIRELKWLKLNHTLAGFQWYLFKYLGNLKKIIGLKKFSGFFNRCMSTCGKSNLMLQMALLQVVR